MIRHLVSASRALATSTLTIGLLLPAFSASAQGTTSDPGSFLPEKTTMVLNLRSLASFSDLDEDHPVRRFAAHPAFENLIDACCEELEITAVAETTEASLPGIMAESLGLEKGELFDLFPGQFTLAVHVDASQVIGALRTLFTGATEDQPELSDAIGGVLVMDTTADEDRLAELLENAVNSSGSGSESSPEVRVVRESSGDQNIIRLEIRQEESDWFAVDSALVGGKYVISVSPNTDYFQSVLQRLGTGAAATASLAESEGYARARSQLTDPDLFMYVLLEDTMSTLDLAITETYAALAEAGPNPATMMLPEATLRRTLGLTDFKDYAVAIKMQPDGAELMGEIRLAGRTGLPAKLMEYGKSDLSLPSFDPVGLKSLQVTSYDFSRVLEMILDYVPQISPMLGGMLEMQLMNLQNQGLDIRGGLIPSLGEGFTLIETYGNPDPAPDQLPSTIWMLGCDDQEALTAAIDGIRNIAGQSLPLEEKAPRSFMDTTIHGVKGLDFLMQQLTPGIEASTLNYAIVDDLLVISMGEDKAIEHAISSLKDGNHDLSGFEAIGECWERWDSANLVSFTYMDVATLVRTLLVSIREELETAALGIGTETDELLARTEKLLAETEAKVAEITGEKADELPAQADAEDPASTVEEEIKQTVAESLGNLSEFSIPDLSSMRFYLTGKTFQTENSLISRGFFGENPE